VVTTIFSLLFTSLVCLVFCPQYLFGAVSIFCSSSLPITGFLGRANDLMQVALHFGCNDVGYGNYQMNTAQPPLFFQCGLF